MGIVHLIAFGVAGILASHITTAGSEVLLARSSTCGPWISDLSDAFTDSEIFHLTYTDAVVKTSQQYVKDCEGDAQSLPQCNMYKQPQLPWTSRTNASCPFGDLCLGSPDSSLYMDTGLIDSRDDLGINGKDTDRIQWRKNVTCIPITADGYTKNGTSSREFTNAHFTGRNNFNYTALYYGPPKYTNYSSLGFADPELQNATYIYTNFADLAVPIYPNPVPQYIVQ